MRQVYARLLTLISHQTMIKLNHYCLQKNTQHLSLSHFDQWGLNMVEKNKTIIREFFAMQNKMASVKDIRQLFAESYTITDLAELDVKSKKKRLILKNESLTLDSLHPGIMFPSKSSLQKKTRYLSGFVYIPKLTNCSYTPWFYLA